MFDTASDAARLDIARDHMLYRVRQYRAQGRDVPEESEFKDAYDKLVALLKKNDKDPCVWHAAMAALGLVLEIP